MGDMGALAWTFAGLLGAVVAMLGAALLFALSRIDRTNDRIDSTNERLDRLHADTVAGFASVTHAIDGLDRRLAAAGG